MSNDSLVYSIRELTELLEKHYEKCPYPDNWIIRKHARVRTKESRGTRGELVDTWLSRSIEQEAPHFKISDLSGGSMLPAVSGLQKKVFSQII